MERYGLGKEPPGGPNIYMFVEAGTFRKASMARFPLTLKELGAKAGLSKVALWEIERGAFVQLWPALDDLAKALSAPVGGLGSGRSTPRKRAIFRPAKSYARELGHLLLYPSEYRRESAEFPDQSGRDADALAGEFLMPDAAFARVWEETRCSSHPPDMLRQNVLPAGRSPGLGAARDFHYGLIK